MAKKKSERVMCDDCGKRPATQAAQFGFMIYPVSKAGVVGKLGKFTKSRDDGPFKMCEKCAASFKRRA